MLNVVFTVLLDVWNLSTPSRYTWVAVMGYPELAAATTWTVAPTFPLAGLLITTFCGLTVTLVDTVDEAPVLLITVPVTVNVPAAKYW